MSTKKLLYPFLVIKLFIALSALLPSSFLFGGIVHNNILKNDLAVSVESNTDSTRCADLSNDSLKRFVRFDHNDGAFNYYSIRLSMFNSSSERGYFYQAARASEIFMNDKGDFDKDTTLFRTGNLDKERTLHIFSDLYDQTILTRQSHLFSGSGFFQNDKSPLSNITPTCNTAQVSCSGNVYTFPAGTSGTAPPPILGYPNYGCLGSEPCPAYYYMQVSVAGNIIINIQQSGNHDVDFICWGPFNSLSDGCSFGLTGTCNIPNKPSCCNNNQTGCTNFYPQGNITDCSYSGSYTETCHILNAQVGQLYILLITNFSQQPGTITFQQTGGTGVTDCNIVVHCSMIAMTANPSTCDGLTNTFSLSGHVEFSNPPPTGTLTVTDITAVPPASQTLFPPFVSPLAYNLSGIQCDGAVHSLTAAFSDSLTCNMTDQYTSPPASCPHADISGGGEICNDGTSSVPVSISLVGMSPFNFTYALNGIPQPAINNYSGPSPYVFNTGIQGIYTLVSISNSICSGPGLISGSATVIVDPLPLPTITGSGTICEGSTGIIYSTEPGNSNYQWTVSAGGTITSGGSTSDQTVTVTWNTPGAQSVSINYHDPKGCTAASAFIFPVTVNSLPVPAISGNQNICEGTANISYTTQAGMTNYSWTVSAGGTITSGGTAADNTVTVSWITAGAENVSVNYNDANNCSAVAPVVYPVTVHPLPVPTVAGPATVCSGIPGSVYMTQPGMTNYLWVVSAGGTITTGGTTNDNSVTVTWNTAGPQTITVNYQDANGCTAVSSFVYDITVDPLPVPVIGGNNKICAGTTGVIYATQAGMTNYTWAVSAGGTITAGGTINDNTVTVTWNTPGANTVSVNLNDPNGCTAVSSTSYSVTIDPLPVPTIAGNNSLCAGTTGVIYTTQAGMANYTWTVSAGGTITSGGSANDNTVTVTWNTAGAQTVSVNYNDANTCTANSPVIWPVTVNPLPLPVIAGSAVLCAGTTGVVYSTQPGNSNYQWVVSAGGTITAGGNTTDNTVTVTWNIPGAQSVSVNYHDPNGCTAVSSAIYPVTINPLPVPVIAGPVAVCLNSSAIYSTAPGMSNYSWTVPPGATITAGAGTNAITIIWSANGIQTITVNYFDGNGCTAVAPGSYNVTVNTLPVPSLVGSNSICVGFPTIYITDPGMTNYSWNISAGGSITAGGGTMDNTVTVLWNTAGLQTVSVNYVMGTGCTAPLPTVYNVAVHALPVPTLAGTNILCAGTSGIVYSTQAGMTNYQWIVSAGGTITSGGTISDHTVTVTWNTPGAQSVSVNFQDINNCTALTPTSYPVTINPLPVPAMSGPVSVCLNSTSIYFTDAGMTNYTWLASAGGTITAGAGTNSITVLWTTTGVKTITVNYSDVNNCSAALPSSYSVNVSTLPLPSLNGTNNVCKGNSIIYSSDAGMSGYSWIVSAGGTLTAGGGPLDNTATVTWNTPGAQSISVNYQVGPGCMAALPTVLPITVKPRPAVTNAANSSVCSATTLGIIPQADLPGTTFSWTATGSSGNVTGYNSLSGIIINDHLVNSGFNIENVTYAVLPSLNGCDGGSSNYVVTVNPIADVIFTPNGQTFCSGGSTSISLSSHVTGATFTWSATASSGSITGFGPGAGNTVSQPLTNSGFINETVTYHVLPAANSCQGTVSDVVVTVVPNPSVAFTPCTDITTTTDAKPFTLRGGTPLGGTYSGTGVNAGIFYPSLAGTGTHPVLYSYSNTNGCGSNASLNISVLGAGAFTCANTLTDVRDNAQYPTVKIGTQCWMATNLNFGITIPSTSMQRDNCQVEKYCLSDNAANCSSFGGLYQWDEIMQFNASEGIQGLCPPAWHIPDENEWTALFNFYTSSGFAGNPLKSTGYSGFNALLVGIHFDNVNWNFSNFATFFWSSTQHSPAKAWAHAMNTFNPSVSYYPGNRSNAFSVRCIKD